MVASIDAQHELYVPWAPLNVQILEEIDYAIHGGQLALGFQQTTKIIDWIDGVLCGWEGD